MAFLVCLSLGLTAAVASSPVISSLDFRKAVLSKTSYSVSNPAASTGTPSGALSVDGTHMAILHEAPEEPLDTIGIVFRAGYAGSQPPAARGGGVTITPMGRLNKGEATSFTLLNNDDATLVSTTYHSIHSTMPNVDGQPHGWYVTGRATGADSSTGMWTGVFMNGIEEVTFIIRLIWNGPDVALTVKYFISAPSAALPPFPILLTGPSRSATVVAIAAVPDFANDVNLFGTTVTDSQLVCSVISYNVGTDTFTFATTTLPFTDPSGDLRLTVDALSSTDYIIAFRSAVPEDKIQVLELSTSSQSTAYSLPLGLSAEIVEVKVASDASGSFSNIVMIIEPASGIMLPGAVPTPARDSLTGGNQLIVARLDRAGGIIQVLPLGGQVGHAATYSNLQVKSGGPNQRLFISVNVAPVTGGPTVWSSPGAMSVTGSTAYTANRQLSLVGYIGSSSSAWEHVHVVQYGTSACADQVSWTNRFLSTYTSPLDPYRTVVTGLMALTSSPTAQMCGLPMYDPPTPLTAFTTNDDEHHLVLFALRGPVGDNTPDTSQYHDLRVHFPVDYEVNRQCTEAGYTRGHPITVLTDFQCTMVPGGVKHSERFQMYLCCKTLDTRGTAERHGNGVKMHAIDDGARTNGVADVLVGVNGAPVIVRGNFNSNGTIGLVMSTAVWLAGPAGLFDSATGRSLRRSRYRDVWYVVTHNNPSNWFAEYSDSGLLTLPNTDASSMAVVTQVFWSNTHDRVVVVRELGNQAFLYTGCWSGSEFIVRQVPRSTYGFDSRKRVSVSFSSDNVAIVALDPATYGADTSSIGQLDFSTCTTTPISFQEIITQHRDTWVGGIAAVSLGSDDSVLYVQTFDSIRTFALSGRVHEPTLVHVADSATLAQEGSLKNDAAMFIGGSGIVCMQAHECFTIWRGKDLFAGVAQGVLAQLRRSQYHTSKWQVDQRFHFTWPVNNPAEVKQTFPSTWKTDEGDYGVIARTVPFDVTRVGRYFVLIHRTGSGAYLVLDSGKAL